jgi:hypothetical protein
MWLADLAWPDVAERAAAGAASRVLGDPTTATVAAGAALLDGLAAELIRHVATWLT